MSFAKKEENHVEENCYNKNCKPFSNKKTKQQGIDGTSLKAGEAKPHQRFQRKGETNVLKNIFSKKANYEILVYFCSV